MKLSSDANVAIRLVKHKVNSSGNITRLYCAKLMLKTVSDDGLLELIQQTLKSTRGCIWSCWRDIRLVTVLLKCQFQSTAADMKMQTTIRVGASKFRFLWGREKTVQVVISLLVNLKIQMFLQFLSTLLQVRMLLQQ